MNHTNKKRQFVYQMDGPWEIIRRRKGELLLKHFFTQELKYKTI